MVQHTQQSLRERVESDIGAVAGNGLFQDEFNRHAQSLRSNIAQVQGPDCEEALNTIDLFTVFLDGAKSIFVRRGGQRAVANHRDVPFPMSAQEIDGLLGRLWQLKIAIMSFRDGVPEDVYSQLVKRMSGKSSYHDDAALLPSDQEIKEILFATLNGNRDYKGKIIAEHLQQWSCVGRHVFTWTLVDALSQAVIYLALAQKQLPAGLTGKRELLNAIRDSICRGPGPLEALFEPPFARAHLTHDEIGTLKERGVFDALDCHQDLKRAVYCYGGKSSKVLQRALIRPQKEIPEFWLCPITHALFAEARKTSGGSVYSKDAIVRWLEAHDTDPLTGVQCLPHTEAQPHIDAGISQYKRVLKEAAITLYKDGKFADAEPYFAQLCELYSGDSTAHYNFLRCLLQLGKHQEALQHLEALDDEVKAKPRIQAIACDCEAIKLSKQRKPVRTLSAKALAYYRDGRYHCAEPYFFQLCKQDPDNVTGHYNLGRCLMKQEKYEKALAYVKTLMDVQQAQALIKVIKYGSDGAIAFKGGQYARAKIAYHTVVMIMQGDEDLACKHTQIQDYKLKMAQCDEEIKATARVSVTSVSVVGATERRGCAADAAPADQGHRPGSPSGPGCC